jgi:perosamine synthetase
MDTSLADLIIIALRKTLGVNCAKLHEPIFRGNEWNYIKECLDSTFVSSVGKFVDRFESDLAALTGSAYVVAVVNGTSALHIALKLSGVQPGDEVLIPSLTFVATANAVSYCGAVPHFVESQTINLGIDAEQLRHYLNHRTEIISGLCINRETNRVIRAIVPMHCFGHPSDMDGLLSIATDFNITMVEDSAESLGSWYGSRHTGTFGKLGILSFNGNKTITTGGGGAILTQDLELAKYAKHITTTAKQPHAWEYRHDMVGYNYRMPNINAALGCAQLEQLPKLLELKRSLHEAYQIAFANVKGVKLFTEPAGSKSNYWLQTLILDEDRIDQLNDVLAVTNSAGYMTRPVWKLLHQLAPYAKCPRMELTVTESLSGRIINIPSNSLPNIDTYL